MAKYLMNTALGAVMATAVVASPAFSQSVVGDLLAKLSESGGTVSFDKSQDGDVTTWNNVVVRGPQDDGEITIDWIKEVESGAAYTITMAPEMVGNFEEQGEAVSISISNDGLAYLVNRSTDGLTVAYSAASLAFSMQAAPDLNNLEISFENVSGSDAIDGTEWESGSGQMKAASFGVEMSVADTGDGGMVMNAQNDDVSIEYEFGGFVGDMTAPDAMLDMFLGFTFLTGSGSGTGTFSDSGQDINFTFSSGPSDLTFDMGDGAMAYSGGAADLAYQIDLSSVGFPPVDIALAEAGVAFGMPIAATEEAADVQYLVELLGLEVGEVLWRMVDPSQTIPRDPADIVIDLAATAKWLVNPADMADNPPSGMPFEVEDVTVNEIRVSVGGAEITANGGAKMMNGGPFPLPIGRVDIAINGVNGLIDKLTALGLLTPDMILPVRAMMGVYTTPVGDDQMTSSVGGESRLARS